MTDIYRDSLPTGSNGYTVVGSTAVQLQVNPRELLTGVIVKADTANAGVVYVGFSSQIDANASTKSGFPLAAGDSVPLTIDDISKVWVIASTSSQKVFFIDQ